MHFCTVKVNSRVMICTLSSTNWKHASELSTLRRFELIWKDWDKSAPINIVIIIINGVMAGGSIGRESDLRSKGQRFKPRQEHKNKFWEIFRVKYILYWHDSLSTCPTPVCMHTHKNDHVRTLKILYVVHVRVWWITERLGSAALAGAVTLLH